MLINKGRFGLLGIACVFVPALILLNIFAWSLRAPPGALPIVALICVRLMTTVATIAILAGMVGAWARLKDETR